jgi:hypothetical protein
VVSGRVCNNQGGDSDMATAPATTTDVNNYSGSLVSPPSNSVGGDSDMATAPATTTDVSNYSGSLFFFRQAIQSVVTMIWQQHLQLQRM